MADVDKIAQQFSVSDGRLTSWYARLVGSNNNRARILKARKGRVVLNISMGYTIAATQMYLGDRNGSLGVIEVSPGPLIKLYSFNSDEHPSVVEAEVWFQGDANPGDGAVTEVVCCER